MKQKKLIFNFFVNRNWKKLPDSRKRAKILADNRKSHHPIETLSARFPKYSSVTLKSQNLQRSYFWPNKLFQHGEFVFTFSETLCCASRLGHKSMEKNEET